MQHKWYNATEIEVGSNSKQIFYMETIEVSRLSALAFFAAGESKYKGKRNYWQNQKNLHIGWFRSCLYNRKQCI